MNSVVAACYYDIVGYCLRYIYLNNIRIPWFEKRWIQIILLKLKITKEMTFGEEVGASISSGDTSDRQ